MGNKKSKNLEKLKKVFNKHGKKHNLINNMDLIIIFFTAVKIDCSVIWTDYQDYIIK